MASFFIDRPVFAWVIAVVIMLAGLISLSILPISQYPDVAPPQVQISAVYPGASPEDTYEGVTRLIEEQLNGVPGLLYFESTSDASGSIGITVTFEPGTNPDTAAVEVQNRVRRVEARLPSSIVQQGIAVTTAGGGTLLVVALTSRNGDTDGLALDLRASGKSLHDAAVEAGHLRFRPILMTSLAFTLGVVPLVVASGAGSKSQQAIGTGVMGGMITATVLAVFFVPVFFVFVIGLLQRHKAG